MGNWDNHCPNCFTEKPAGNRQCQHCGYDEQNSRSPAALPVRTILHDQFVVGRVLGNPGGFGITYLCWDIQLATRVAIKEFMPRDNAVRDRDGCSVVAHSGKDQEFFEYGLKAFLAEARTVAGLNHPNIVRIRAYFEQNHTAYLVMDYYEGFSLAEYVKQQGGSLPEKAAMGIMGFVLDGLRHVHDAGYLHRDVKLQNIYLTDRGQVILLDFGTARYAIGEHSRSLSVVVTPGYSPFEQYSTKGAQGPWTDIYASGATLYVLLTGQTPDPAPDRVMADTLAPPKEIQPRLSPSVSAGIMGALRVKAEDRPQSIDELRGLLGGQPVSDPPKPAPDPQPPGPDPKKAGWWQNRKVQLGLALVLVMLGLVYWNLAKKGELIVRTEPGDAEIYIGGKPSGKGEVRLSGLSPGELEVKASRSGYGEDRKMVTLRSGGRTEVMLRLPLLTGSLSVKTEPSGAEIVIDGVVKGKSPLDVSDLKPGQVKVRASMDDKGFTTQEKSVEIVSGKETAVELVLSKVGPKILDEWTDPVTGMKFMWVPGGSFDMGSPDGETGGSSDEGPVHKVEVDGFWMGKYEVTNAQYRKWKADHTSGDYRGISLNGDNQPVVYVNWEEVRDYAQWLDRQNGGKSMFKIPSEAQWEYACRGGTKTSRYWGDNPDLACQYANVGDQTAMAKWSSWVSIHNCSDGYEVSSTSGQFKGNGFGLYDMLGNVWEWCEDVYISDIYGRSSNSKNPIYTSGGPNRVIRGGSWNAPPVFVYCAGRFKYDPADRNFNVGFRLLRMP